MNSNLYISGDAKMYGNMASTYADGIYNGGNVYIEGNIDISNDVYIVDRASALNILNELPSDTVIQIGNSDYVIPDESLAPIIVAVATPTHPTLTISDLQAFKKPSVGFENWEYQLLEDDTQIGLVPRLIEEYSITYQNLHGATHTNPPTYTAETPTFTLTDPTYRRCRYFAGWFNENGIRVMQIKQGTTGNIVLTARWDNVGCRRMGRVC